jgi:hypothetical protein
MSAIRLYDDIEHQKMEIRCMRKCYVHKSNFCMKSFKLTGLEKKLADIDSYVRNFGLHGSFPSKAELQANIWTPLSKVREEIKMMVEEIKMCPEAYYIFISAVEEEMRLD